MQAQGDHVLIRRPPPKNSEGLIHLPDSFGKTLSYGRIISIGDGVAKHSVTVKEGDVVAFDPNGVVDLELDPMRDAEICVAHATHLFCTLAEKQLEARKLPLPK